jgi:hypothetical protein
VYIFAKSLKDDERMPQATKLICATLYMYAMKMFAYYGGEIIVTTLPEAEYLG